MVGPAMALTAHEPAVQSAAVSDSPRVRIGLSLYLWRGLRIIGLLTLGSLALGTGFMVLVLRLPFSWGATLVAACAVALVFLLMVLWASWNGPFALATLTGEGIRLGWGPRVQVVPWASVRRLHREGSSSPGPGPHVWYLSWASEGAPARSYAITDAPALAILQYPSPPRPSFLKLGGRRRSAERPNPVGREWVAARGHAYRWLFLLWLALFAATVYLGSFRSPATLLLAWLLVAPTCAIVTLGVVLRWRAGRIARTFPRAVLIDSGAVTGIFTLSDGKDRLVRRVTRTIRYGNIAELKPWRGATGLTGSPAPAAVFGTFEPDLVHPSMQLGRTPLDRDASGRKPHDILYLARENYEPVRAAWEKWKLGAGMSGDEANADAAGAWMAASEVHRSGPVRLPPPPGG